MKSKIYLFVLFAGLLCGAHLTAMAVLPPIAIKGTVIFRFCRLASNVADGT